MSKILGKGIYIMGEPSVAAGSLAVGSSVFTNVNGVKKEFIVVHQGKPSSLYDDSCNGTWLLMKDCYEERVWQSSNVNKYESSEINTYLNGTFLNLFDSNIKNIIKQVKIPYRKNGGSDGTNLSGSNGLSCKIFLLSGYEVGWTSSDHQYFSQDGAKLSYFESGNETSAKNKRIAYLNGSASLWWLRSPRTSNTYYVWFVNASGNYDYDDASYSYGIRPAFIIPSTALIDSEGIITGKTQSLTGTWVFNSALGAWPSSLNNTNLYTTFESNGTTYPTFNFTYGTTTGLYYNSTLAYTLASGGELVSTWANTAYRVITFTTPFKRDTNPEFYDWFVSNSVQQQSWRLNSRITVNALPSYAKSTSASTKYLDSTQSTPYFTGLKYTVNDGTSIFNQISVRGSMERLVENITSGMYAGRYRYITRVYAYLQSNPSYFGYGQSYNSLTNTNASGGTFPASNPKVEIAIDTPEILHFIDEPTGDLLTWLNANATPV